MTTVLAVGLECILAGTGWEMEEAFGVDRTMGAAASARDNLSLELVSNFEIVESSRSKKQAEINVAAS